MSKPTAQPRPYCRGEKRDGTPCKNRAAKGSALCGTHGGGTKPTGRPTILSKDLVDSIAEVVRAGAFYEEAALTVGIGRSTLYKWREEGEADIEHGKATLAAYFVDALTRASAEAEQAAAQAILSARYTDWRAAAWYLERRNPGRWGRRDHVEHSGAVKTGEPILVEAPDDAAAEVAAILARAGAVDAKPPAKTKRAKGTA